MRTNEEYYELVLKNRALAADPAVTRCTCHKTACEWHGRCKECIALHRYHGDHVPTCLQPMLRDKVAAIAVVAEMSTARKPDTPMEQREYVKARDAQAGDA